MFHCFEVTLKNRHVETFCCLFEAGKPFSKFKVKVLLYRGTVPHGSPHVPISHRPQLGLALAVHSPTIGDQSGRFVGEHVSFVGDLGRDAPRRDPRIR